MRILSIPVLVTFLVVTVAFLSSCLQPNMPVNEEMPLVFSQDTVFFDTVFTTKGSATRLLKVENEASEGISADISFENPNTVFRMNVDGVTGEAFTNVNIPAKDSIYIFLEVTIDPDQPLSVSPFVIEEKLLFETEFAQQEVVLTAWGQNANYITPEANKGRIALLSCDFGEQVWDDPKPYVIYGVLVVDSCNIIWPKGARIYVHGGVINNEIGIYNDGLVFFGANGSLEARGEVDDPVIVQGDRLEPAFDEIPGQWSGLRFSAGAECNLEHTQILNAINGLVLDSASNASLNACQIINSGGIGLAARHAELQATNCLIANGSVHPVQLTFGGNYAFNFCTIVNYGNISFSFLANNFTCYDDQCDEVAFNDLQLTVKNSIISGSTADQLALINGEESEVRFNLDLSYNLVRIEDLLENDPDFFETICEPCWNFDQGEALFENPDELNFRLDSLSQASDLGEFDPDVPVDILNVMRDRMNPDLGCFERELP